MVAEKCAYPNKGQSSNATFVDFEFKGWHCSVNWFLPHLEQQTDYQSQIYKHVLMEQ